MQELYAVEHLIEVSVQSTVQGVVTQLVLAFGHLETLRVETDGADDDETLAIGDIRNAVQGIMRLLDVALPVLARIAGLDLQADLDVECGTILAIVTDGGGEDDDEP